LVVAGVLLGVGACVKLVAPYALLVVLAFELLLLLARGGGAAMVGPLPSSTGAARRDLCRRHRDDVGPFAGPRLAGPAL